MCSGVLAKGLGQKTIPGAGVPPAVGANSRPGPREEDVRKTFQERTFQAQGKMERQTARFIHRSLRESCAGQTRDAERLWD